MKLYKILLFSLIGNFLLAQSDSSIAIGTMIPDSNAILELKSNNKGFLPPRLSTIQRNAIQNSNGVPPADLNPGMAIYNTNTNYLEYYNDSCWIPYPYTKCDECDFTMTFANGNTATIDRVVEDSLILDLQITQTNGNRQLMALVLNSEIPNGIRVVIDPATFYSDQGNIKIKFYTTPFASSDIVHRFVFSAFCDTRIQTIQFDLSLAPCYQVNIVDNDVNFDLSARMTQDFPAANHINTPVCVLLYIEPNKTILSNATTTASLSVGPFASGSLVGILNEGLIQGKGGDGGIAYGLNPAFKDGLTGGDGLKLTPNVNTYISNQRGYIFGGGGGGGAGAVYLLNFPSLPPPIGNIVPPGLMVFGASGSGGAGKGLKGDIATSFPGVPPAFPNMYTIGEDGTDLIAGAPGRSQNVNLEENIVGFSVGIGYATVSISVDANGGSGGQYGFKGEDANLEVNINGYLDPIAITIPIFGIPFTFDLPKMKLIEIPINLEAGSGGAAGYAIRTSGAQVIQLNNTINPLTPPATNPTFIMSQSIRGNFGN